VAKLWIARHKRPDDPLGSAFESLRQAVAARLAAELGLHVQYEPCDEDYVDMSVAGSATRLARFARELYARYGLAGFVVDLEEGDNGEVFVYYTGNLPVVDLQC